MSTTAGPRNAGRAPWLLVGFKNLIWSSSFRTGDTANVMINKVTVDFKCHPVEEDDDRARFEFTLADGQKRSHVSFEVKFDELTEPEFTLVNQFVQDDLPIHEEMPTAICRVLSLALAQSNLSTDEHI